MLSYYGDIPETPAVEYLVTPQSTDEAARQATEPQSYGDEFKPKPNPDIKALVGRLTELEAECTQLYDKLYMGETPTYMEREDLHARIRVADREKAAICAQLSQLYTANEV